jgi:hypothetical protein
MAVAIGRQGVGSGRRSGPARGASGAKPAARPPARSPRPAARSARWWCRGGAGGPASAARPRSSAAGSGMRRARPGTRDRESVLPALHHLPFKTVIGYGVGYFAFNLAFSLSAAFLLHYYTNVAGIAAAAVGTHVPRRPPLGCVRRPARRPAGRPDHVQVGLVLPLHHDEKLEDFITPITPSRTFARKHAVARSRSDAGLGPTRDLGVVCD